MVANINFDKNVVGTPVLDSAGDTVTYSFSVLNQGPDAIADLQLSDTILPGVGVSFDLEAAVAAGDVVLAGDTNNNGILEVGETWTFTEAAGSDVFTYAITQADLDSNGTAEPNPIGTPDIVGQIDNEAFIVARNANGDVIAAAREGAAAAIEFAPDIAIDKEFVNFTGGNGNQVGDAVGDVLNYNVTVTNTGNVTLTGVTVTDPLTGQAVSGVTLAPGASQVFASSYVLTQNDLDGAGNAGADLDIDNTATADSNETPPVDDDEVVPLVQTPGLAIDKEFVNFTGGNGNQIGDAVGDVLNYNVTVTNTGNVTLTGVTVTDPLTGQAVSGVTLAPGASQVFASSYVLTQNDLDGAGNAGADLDIDNTATADSNETPPVDDDEVVPLVQTPGLAIDKTFLNVNGVVGEQANSVGDVINYSVAVTNTGNQTLTGVTVVDPLTGQNVPAFTLAVGATQTFTSSYVVTQADLDGAGNAGADLDIDNTATADSNETPPVDDDEVVPLVQTPGLAIDKEFVNFTGGNGNQIGDAVGDVLNYNVTVTNTGNVTLTGVTVTDPLTGQAVSGVTLAPGASQVFASSYVLTQNDLDGAGNAGADLDIDNTATADSNETPPVDDDEVVPLVQTPGLAIDKTFLNVNGVVGEQANSVGDVINYSVAVTNTGNQTLTGVTVVDPLTGQNVPAFTLAVGATQTFTSSYVVTQADLDGAGNAGADLDIDNTATADSNETPPVDDDEVVPLVQTPGLAIDKEFVNFTGGNGNQIGDAVGDVLNYNVTVTNTGNVTLTGVTVTDPLTGQAVSGVTLAPGASQVFASSYVLTQNDLDGAGNAGADLDIDNTATADSNETPPVDDDEVVPLVQTPGLAIDKTFLNVNGVVGEQANSVGDVINYSVAVTNTGNQTLTGVTVVDPLTGQNVPAFTLAVGATQTFTSSYVVTQADLDGAGNAGADLDIDNTATADSNETPPVDDDEVVPLQTNPALALDKVVQDVDGVVGGSVDEAGDIITYDLTVTNTGNVTLTNVTVVDPLTGTNVNVGTLAVGASTTVQDRTYTVLQADIDNLGGGDSDIDNIATADSDQTGPVTDTAVVPIVLPPNEEPGVRTPGFWQNPRNGGTFWDGIEGNEAHSGPGFPPGELLYAVDANCDGTIDAQKGLLIGDYNQNGLTDANEDTLFISLADAQALVGSGGGSDGVEKIGRDLTATWLNFLSGNDIDNPGTADDATSPQHFINDAVTWLQVYGDASPLSVNDPLEDCDVYSANHTAVRSNSAAWNTATFLDHSAAQIHAALDLYNNTGSIGGINFAPTADLFA